MSSSSDVFISNADPVKQVAAAINAVIHIVDDDEEDNAGGCCCSMKSVLLFVLAAPSERRLRW